jgi:hypothetical protein
MRRPSGNGNGKSITTCNPSKIKDLLDENRAPGQSYNAFICQLVALWMYDDKEIAAKRGLFEQGRSSRSK